MRPGDPLLLLAAAIVIAIPLALVYVLISRWWKHRPIWKAIESPTKRDGFRLHERPSNVSALTHKPVRKSAPKKTAA